MTKAEIKKDLKRIGVLRNRNAKLQEEVFDLMDKYKYEWWDGSFDEGMWALEELMKEHL